ncbi:MAG: ferrichrome ABC transporter permease, partial [Planctomycetota bacterium]|nr:ferrichrome ABC transporter permease [Planctomycetota bacterium]
MLRYATTIFLGAFLLFQVQPIVGKAILPWFGGTPAVWTTCMMFFQILLLGGYAYAHLLAAWLPLRTQGLLHLALLGMSLAALPIMPSEAWKPAGEGSPVARILALLAVSVGAPYFMLSTTGPLLQAWFLQEHPGRSPYRLYALSNAGSLLGLLGYPFLIEPSLDLHMQGVVWAGLYVLFVGICGFSAWRIASLQEALGPGAAADTATLGRMAIPNRGTESGSAAAARGVAVRAAASPGGTEASRAAGMAGGSSLAARPGAEGGLAEAAGACGGCEAGSVSPERSIAPEAPSVFQQAMWFGLAMFGSLMLLATTNQISLDVSVVPFMWVAPLSLYLISFIISFERERWYWRPVWLPLLAISAAGACVVLWRGVYASVLVQALVYPATMFCCCMACHGELARLKPSGRYLTRFYLIMASGGAAGGILAAVAAPNLLSGFWEYHISWAGACLLVALAVIADLRPAARPAPPRALAGVIAASAAALPLWAALVATLWLHYRDQRKWVIASARNFYGVLRVKTTSSGGKDGLTLVHGRIAHGFQFDEGEYRNKPISYFSPESGFGKAMLYLRTRAGREGAKGLRIGVLGLGAGCMAAWGEDGDHMKFY